MIRFACPRCNGVSQQPDNVTGTVFNCPNCGQPLQAPPAPEKESALASAPNSDLAAPISAPLVSAPPVPPPPVASSATLSEGDRPSTPPPSPRRPIEAAAPTPAIPVHARRPARESDDDFDDDYSSIARLGIRGGRYAPEVLARAASSGLVCSLLSLALLLVSFMVFVMALSSQRHRFGSENETLLLIAMLIVLGSLVLALLAIVYSSRGLDRNNTYNRGQATAGLVCGIISLVIGSLIGLFTFCFGILAFSMRG